jgi:hypothetical protein
MGIEGDFLKQLNSPLSGGEHEYIEDRVLPDFQGRD